MADVYLTLRPSKQNIRHTWRTTIQKGIAGSEKRNTIFSWPRISTGISIKTATPKQSAWLRSRLYKYVDGTWGIPIWPDHTTLSSQAASGQSTLNVVDANYRHFYEDRELIIVDKSLASFDNYEVVTIVTASGTAITISGTLSATWPTGSFVMPVYDCRINASESIKRRTIQFDEIEIEAREAYETQRSFTYSLPSSGADTYLSYDLFLTAPIGSLKHTLNRPYNLIQYTGIGYKYGYYDETSMPLSMSFILDSMENVYNLRNFFDSKRGRLGSFWVPSWNKDIIVTAAIGAADTTLTIEDIDYSSFYLSNDIINRHIWIRFPDKTWVCRKINWASDVSIGIDSAIGTSVSTENLDKMYISFLVFCRLDLDELEIEYIYPKGTIAQLKLNFMGLVEETT